MQNNPVAIASDHAGFEQKQQLITWLRELGFEVHDLGPATDERVDYPDYAEKVAGQVASGVAVRGILVCGTGIGMAIAANKRQGIRAANIISPSFATLAREHNDVNVIALSGRFVDLNTNKEIVNNFLVTDFGEGRHAERVRKIQGLEAAQRL
ncbi:MAG: ribose 5-phosphate isomerase B [Coriobacteriales bacterium]|nr:ribose 5-phosphate isomerase B [Coriobacteriales bacterium]